MLCHLCGRTLTPDHDCRRLGAGPTPVVPAWAKAVESGVAIVVAGSVTLALVAVVATPTLGAKRSTRLKWEEREKQVRAAVADAEPER